MKVVLASYGSRGDVEPCAAVGRELLRRGHDVCMAVPPNMLGFVESAGLAAASYGPDSREQMNPAADFVRDFSTKIRNPIDMFTEVVERVSRVKTSKTATLKSLAEGADLLVAGFNERGLAANIAEYYGIPLAVVHFFPERVSPSGGLYASVAKDTDDAQRRTLGLSEPPGASALPVLEIQAYDQLCLPGPAAEWVEPDGRQPFVGALTLELPTDADDEVLSWIAAGTAPIYFGFGSTPVVPFADTVATISAACLQLGERALICSGPNDFAPIPDIEHVRDCACGQPRGHLSGVPRGGAPRRRGHHSRGPAGRNSHADSLALARSASLGGRGHRAESRCCATIFGHHPAITGRRPALHPHSAIRRPRR